MTPEDIAAIGAIAAVLVSTIALVVSMVASARQSKMQTFLAYTERYQQLFIDMPSGILFESFDISTVPLDQQEFVRQRIRGYFDLCSEEFYLAEQSMVHKDAWKLWSEGIKHYIQLPVFLNEWESYNINKSYQKEFTKYVNQIKPIKMANKSQ